MLLSFEQIQSLAFGVHEIKKTQDGIEFFRMSEARSNAHGLESIDFLNKSYATASVSLDFYTDSEFFSFAYTNAVKRFSRNYYYFEILIDGKSVAIVGEENATKLQGSFFLPLERGRKRVTLLFPFGFSATLTRVELSDGAYAERAKKARKLLFYGDSITHGYDAKSPSNSYVNRIALRTNSAVINLGIGGARFDSRVVMPTLEKPDYIFVAYGTNDWANKSNDDFTKDCADFFQAIANTHAETPVFVLLPIWRMNWQTPTCFQGSLLKAREIIAEKVKAYPFMQVIDTWDFLPHDLAYFSDGLHPNDEGFAYYANGILQAVETIFNEE